MAYCSGSWTDEASACTLAPYLWSLLFGDLFLDQDKFWFLLFSTNDRFRLRLIACLLFYFILFYFTLLYFTLLFTLLHSQFITGGIFIFLK